MTPVVAALDEEVELLWDGGLHDASLDRLEVDWSTRTCVFLFSDIDLGDDDGPRRARVVFDDFLFVSVDPPIVSPGRPQPDVGSPMIDAGRGVGGGVLATRPPHVPADHLLRWVFVEPWNGFIHVCARRARLDWL